MNSQPNPPHSADNPLEKLQGSIERVTFHSESSGFCVLRIKVKSHRKCCRRAKIDHLYRLNFDQE
ncbi:MAG: hypothetical protein LUP98_07870 [Methylococcaceae bacterium]|nr:hypothetical protein [Methylococcaceae bacterium]